MSKLEKRRSVCVGVFVCVGGESTRHYLHKEQKLSFGFYVHLNSFNFPFTRYLSEPACSFKQTHYGLMFFSGVCCFTLKEYNREWPVAYV